MSNEKSIKQIMENFSRWYSPAEDISKTTDFFSTQEVLDAINQLDPSIEADPKKIYQLMIDFGYRYTPDPQKMTFQLKWLLIRNF